MASGAKVPRAFFWRRLHSITGIWLVIFLIEHLLTNSQAALWIGEDGSGFIHAVNGIKNLPYLEAIEIFLIGVPIIIHLVWGIVYLRMGEISSFPTKGTKPSLTQYPRNHAYSWQRITSWILVLALIGHIIQMRFIEYPYSAKMDGVKYYMVRVDFDEGLYTLAARLNVQLYDQNMVELQKQQMGREGSDVSLSAGFWGNFVESFQGIFQTSMDGVIEGDQRHQLLMNQKNQQQREFLEALEQRPLGPNQVIAVASDFGTAELLMVRETFKMPIMIALYTIFVLSACFHGFNGLWTFLITWGVSLTEKSQRVMRRLSTLLMVAVAFMGLAAIWLTFWINLKQ